ncbi:MAG: hypothetical protein NTW21_25350 [Verrucomicrobia bacterium]|nr:hypothetical protein [Verrucomicrobiota bacterium]
MKNRIITADYADSADGFEEIILQPSVLSAPSAVRKTKEFLTADYADSADGSEEENPLSSVLSAQSAVKHLPIYRMQP